MHLALQQVAELANVAFEEPRPGLDELRVALVVDVPTHGPEHLPMS